MRAKTLSEMIHRSNSAMNSIGVGNSFVYGAYGQLRRMTNDVSMEDILLPIETSQETLSAAVSAAVSAACERLRCTASELREVVLTRSNEEVDSCVRSFYKWMRSATEGSESVSIDVPQSVEFTYVMCDVHTSEEMQGAVMCKWWQRADNLVYFANNRYFIRVPR